MRCDKWVGVGSILIYTNFGLCNSFRNGTLMSGSNCLYGKNYHNHKIWTIYKTLTNSEKQTWRMLNYKAVQCGSLFLCQADGNVCNSKWEQSEKIRTFVSPTVSRIYCFKVPQHCLSPRSSDNIISLYKTNCNCTPHAYIPVLKCLRSISKV